MLKEYLESIKDLTPESNEHTHRRPLENLLDSLKDHFNKEFKIEHEPKRERGSQPDFRISFQGLNIGYIENKKVGTDLNQLLKNDQVLKYLELNPNLMLTDYLNFVWVGKDEENKPLIKREISIASLDEPPKPPKPNPQTAERDLIELFRGFFNHEAAPITNAKDFATRLSAPTKYLKDALIQYQKDDQVSSIFKNFKEYLYEELSFEDFSDAFAQTLTYSLFLAKLNHPFEKIDFNNVRSTIPKNFAVIREMADFLKKLDEIKEIQWLLNEILSSINHVDMDSILKDLNDDKDPYLHFYETFLSAYDPKLREKKGVYYTPDPVVEFIINALDSLLKTHFKDAPLGLKSALDNENIKLLDFATGTGTFLLEAFRKALEVRKTSDGGTSTKEDKYQNLLKQFYGFEYLIAPYAIAHLNLSQAFKEEFKKPLKGNDVLQIILTNTLIQPSEIIAYRGLNPIFEKELKSAQEIKKNENILIITGNPPYSGASSNKGLFEWEVKATYGIEPEFQTIEIEKNVKLTDKIQTLLSSVQIQKQSGSKNALKELKKLHSKYKLQKEKNPKWLLDDYVKFMRFAQNKIESLGHGLFGFISNNAFLDNPTFRGLRRSLLECYDELYILNLHGNARKREIPILIENPQFWLQYAICHISIGKFKEAQDYLNQAYGKAKQKNRLYNVDYIDNQQARLYIYQGIETEYKEDAFSFFKKAVALLGGRIKEDEYKYSIIESFWNFLEKHFLHFEKNKQEVIQKVLADHHEKFCNFCGQGSWYKQKIIRGCEKVFEKYLPNPEKPNLSKNLSSK
ncbi:N-6 DNA methylase [Helicobacter pylori]|uniref:N-6 DNA methylase n=1 Tax=Helicobacter pylori TaxID=210 RepID=UPI001F5B9F6A|nr:N-6 DNA methylase [Helicobacter pylori]